MKYIWIITAALFLLMLLPWISLCFRKRRAKRKVCTRSDTSKNMDLNAALQPFGFQYDMRKDLFYSSMHTWQRKMGYCRFYDEKAPVLDMDIDSEPFYFTYNGYDWLVEVWKGQYGMTTGAEVGIYRTEEQPDRNPAELSYESVPDGQRLPMSIVLKKITGFYFKERNTIGG